jgi:hypothetical protein
MGYDVTGRLVRKIQNSFYRVNILGSRLLPIGTGSDSLIGRPETNMSVYILAGDEWTGPYYEAMAAVAAAKIKIRRKAGILGLVQRFWQVQRANRKLLQLLADLPPKIPPTVMAELQAVIPKLKELHISTSGLLELSARKGLTNRTFFNSSLQSIAECNEKLLDFIELFALAFDDQLTQDASRAMAEHQRGETVKMDSLLR